MNNEEEVIEILDDFEEDTIIIPPISNEMIQNTVDEQEVVTMGEEPYVEQPLNNNLEIRSSEKITSPENVAQEFKNLEDVNYAPIKPEKQEIKIDTDPTNDNSKSGLGLIIVLFILLIAFIIALPYISNLF